MLLSLLTLSPGLENPSGFLLPVFLLFKLTTSFRLGHAFLETFSFLAMTSVCWFSAYSSCHFLFGKRKRKLSLFDAVIQCEFTKVGCRNPSSLPFVRNGIQASSLCDPICKWTETCISILRPLSSFPVHSSPHVTWSLWRFKSNSNLAFIVPEEPYIHWLIIKPCILYDHYLHRGNGGSKLRSFSKADQQRSDRDGFELKPGLQGFASNLCSATLWTPHSQRLLCFHSLLSPQSLDSTWQAFKKCVWNKWTNQRTTFGWLLCLKRQSVKTLRHLPSEVPQGITGIIFQNRL